MYHCIEDNGTNSNYVSVSVFEKQLKYLSDNGYKTYTMRQLTEMINNGEEIDEKAVVLTFDDGYRNNYTNALPLLEKYGLCGTMYMISNAVSGTNFCTSDMLREINAGGILEIGSHTVNHVDLSKLSAEKQREEMVNSKAFLEKVIGSEVVSFCYPFGGHNSDSLKIAEEAGYSSAVTIVNGSANSNQSMFELKRHRVTDSTSMKDILSK